MTLRRKLLGMLLLVFSIPHSLADDIGGTLPPMPGLDDLVLGPFFGQSVAGAVRFDLSPVVSKVTGIFIKDGNSVSNVMSGFSGFSPSTHGYCQRFLKPGKKTMIFKGVNAIGQEMDQEISFTVVSSGEQSVYCTSEEGGRVFLNAKPEVTVWVSKPAAPQPDVPDFPDLPPFRPGVGKYFSSYAKRFPNNAMRDNISLTESNRMVFVELQRVAKQFGVGQGSLFDRARAAGQSTANKRGYGNTPCAEVQSEVLRKVFARVGVNGDFEGSPLVTDLNKILARMGWVVWDSKLYYPTPGAIGMHTTGISPSHTYLMGGLPENSSKNIRGVGFDFGEYADGRFILDNASGSGRDLATLSPKLIAFQYTTGAFWLPPGVVPAARKK